MTIQCDIASVLIKDIVKLAHRLLELYAGAAQLTLSGGHVIQRVCDRDTARTTVCADAGRARQLHMC